MDIWDSEFFQDRHHDLVKAAAFKKIAQSIERIDRRMREQAEVRLEISKALQKLAASRSGATAPATPEEAMKKIRYGF